MMTSIPRPSAALANSAISSGVRWAEMMRHSCGTAKSVSTSEAARIVSQSDLLPMMMDTSGGAMGLLTLRERESRLAIEVPQAFRFDDVVSSAGNLLIEARDLVVRDGP